MRDIRPYSGNDIVFCRNNYYWADLRKGVTSHIFQNVNFKHEKLIRYSSYELETRNDYPMIILLHLLRFLSPAHFLYGRGKVHTCTTHGRKSAVLYLRFDGHHFWQEVVYIFKCRILKQKALHTYKVRGPHCFEMVIAWKVSKFGVLCKFAPLLKSTHILQLIL